MPVYHHAFYAMATAAIRGLDRTINVRTHTCRPCSSMMLIPRRSSTYYLSTSFAISSRYDHDISLLTGRPGYVYTAMSSEYPPCPERIARHILILRVHGSRTFKKPISLVFGQALLRTHSKFSLEATTSGFELKYLGFNLYTGMISSNM